MVLMRWVSNVWAITIANAKQPIGKRLTRRLFETEIYGNKASVLGDSDLKEKIQLQLSRKVEPVVRGDRQPANIRKIEYGLIDAYYGYIDLFQR